MEYLGFVISNEGIQPQPSKVKVILNMTLSATIKQLRGFIGLINFYRDLFRGRAHYLAPLTEMLKGKKRGSLTWTEKGKKSYEKVKQMAAKQALLVYPDFNRTFHIYTDSSDYQMGTIIAQNKQVIVYWSRKMTDTQKKYPTIEQ